MNKIEVKQKIDDYFSKEIPDSKQTKKIIECEHDGKFLPIETIHQKILTLIKEKI
jgi:hypothetical protein